MQLRIKFFKRNIELRGLHIIKVDVIRIYLGYNIARSRDRARDRTHTHTNTHILQGS
jgi:hypothetical protein